MSQIAEARAGAQTCDGLRRGPTDRRVSMLGAGSGWVLRRPALPAMMLLGRLQSREPAASLIWEK